MKKVTLLTLLFAGMLLMPVLSKAQLTASGALAVSATVDSTISVVFNSNGSGVALSGAGTNAASLNLGNISAYGALSPNVTRTVGATNFTVSTPFDINVQKSNGASANYSLTAQLQSADAVNSWALGAQAITNGSAATLTSSGSYGLATYTLNLTVPLASAAGSISNTINFVATAN